MDEEIHTQLDVGVESDQVDERYQHLKGLLYHYADFNMVDVVNDMETRSALFSDLSPEDQHFLQEQLILFSRNNDPRMLDALRMMGRETDVALIDQLEQRGGYALDNLRVATHLFTLTYRMWEMNNLVREGLLDGMEHQIVAQQKLQEIYKAAIALSKYTIKATHVTHPEFEEAVNKDQLLLKSVSGETAHFEGDGVYVGILGSYRDWNSGKIFEFPLSLADTLPIIVGYNNPQAMANTLGEILYLKDSIRNPAIAHGLIQWRQPEFDTEPIDRTKLELLGEVLGVDPYIIQDEEGRDCVAADTNLPPIIWASACRALRIRRFIPQKELSKLQLEVEGSHDKPISSSHGLIINFPDDPYETMADGVRIKGIRRISKIAA